MSIFSYFGTSQDHYNSASGYFSKASESVSNIASNLWSGLSNTNHLK